MFQPVPYHYPFGYYQIYNQYPFDYYHEYVRQINPEVYRMLNLLNQERQKAGLNPLSINNSLTQVAQLKANDAVTVTCEHYSPTFGGDEGKMLKDAGITGLSLGWILYCGQPGTAEEAINWWMNISTGGHREQILTPGYNYVGIGTAVSSNGTRSWSVIFQQTQQAPDAGPGPSPGPGPEVPSTVDDGSRYTAIWVKSDGVPFVARHNMTSSQYQQQFNQLVGQQGYTLTFINGYTVNGQPRFNAIWEKRSLPPFIARHGLNSQAYQQEFDNLLRQGYRLKMVSGYEVNGQAHYAAIWEMSAGPEWVARHGLTAQQYQQQFNQLVGQGFRLKMVNGYSVGGQVRYAAIWVKDGGTPFVARHGLTAQQYQQQFNQLVGQQGYRLTWVSCYHSGGDKRYAAIWELSPSPAWISRHGMSSSVFQQEFNRLVSAGYRLIHLSGC